MEDDQLDMDECSLELKKEVDETDIEIKIEAETGIDDCGDYRVSSVGTSKRSGSQAGRFASKTLKPDATNRCLPAADHSTSKRQKTGPIRGSSSRIASTSKITAASCPSSEVKSLHTCKKCGQGFSHLSRYNSHLLVHANERLSTCRECGKVYKRACSLISHMRSHTDFPCDVCRKSFQDRPSLKLHVCVKPKTVCNVAKKQPYRCLKCVKEFCTEELLKSHMSVHSTDREYECLKCEKKLPSSILLLEHLKTHKEQTTNMRVFGKMCDKQSDLPAGTFSQKTIARATKPIATHSRLSDVPISVSFPKTVSQAAIPTEIKPHRCFNCKKTFETNDALTAHMSVHLQRAMPYSCNICHKPFEKRSALDAHLITHTNGTLYSCQDCDKAFKHENSLKVHKIVHHLSTSASNQTDVQPTVGSAARVVRGHKCPDCGHMSKSSIGLKLHCRSHYAERPYSCPDCSEKFTVRKQFLRHCRTHIPETFLCTECGDNFASPSDFKRHMSTHMEQTFFQCNLCGRKFTKRSELKKHMIVHSDDAPYLCADCGKQFKIERLLKQHMVSHSDLRPFSCEECGKCFSRFASLKHHILTHLKNPREVS